MSTENAIIIVRMDELTELLQSLSSSPWMTLLEAARYLRCSKRKIETLIAQGHLPFSRQDPTIKQSPRLIHRKYLIAFLVTGKNAEKQRLSSEESRLVEELL